jgi:glycosyltransferase involved in cell wall biosynthesis
MFRAILYYLRKASAITRVTQRHLERSGDALPLCFYSYWMDHKSLAATELADLHRGSIAVSRTHGYDLYADRHPHCYLPLRAQIATRLTAIFPVSDNGARELTRHVPAGANIITARLGVLPSEAFSEPGGLGTDRPLVISVGSLIPLKRIGLLIEALVSMESRSGISWWHFGDGLLREGLDRQAAAQLRIPYVFHGYVRHRDLRLRLQRVACHAVLVSTSASEGIPVSMMEAMAEGIPCIGTRVGGVEELVIDGVNGYLLPPTPEPEEVGDALRRFFDLSAREQAAMRRAAFETWSSRFDAAKNYASFADQLHRMLHHP